LDGSSLPRPQTLTELMAMKFPYAEEAERDYRRGYHDGFYAAMETLEKVIRDELHERLWDFWHGELLVWRMGFPHGDSPLYEEPPRPQFTRPRRQIKGQKGIVYIVRAEGTSRVKIGRSAKDGPRLASLQTASPYRLKVLRKIPTEDIAFLERMLHKRYARYRQQGEWFELPAQVLDDLLRENFVQER
jgi:Meiotically up-regulated gene 113